MTAIVILTCMVCSDFLFKVRQYVPHGRVSCECVYKFTQLIPVWSIGYALFYRGVERKAADSSLTTQATPTTTTASVEFVLNDLFYYIIIGILEFLVILFFLLFLCVSVCCCTCRHRGEYDITSQRPGLEKISPATSLPSMSTYNFSSQQMLKTTCIQMEEVDNILQWRFNH